MTPVFHLGDAKMAIVGLNLNCIVLPHLVKNRHQFYLAIAAVLGSMFFQMLAAMIGSLSFGKVCTVFNIVLDMFAFVLLILAAGGLTARDLASGVGEAFEAARKGPEGDQSVVVPITGQMKKAPPKSAARADDEDGRTVYVIDEPPPQPPATEKPRDTGPIPLE
jgi:hypothetical protein